MKVSSTIIAISCASSSAAFAPHSSAARQPTVVKGYLDDLSSELYKEDATPDVEADARENNAMKKDEQDRFGPGSFESFVEFDEFDGGDGQMGVAGDGVQGLDKSDFATGEIASTMNKSQMRSARNAWGTSSGYADELRAKGVDSARAQQMENWNNQQEIKKKKEAQRFMTEDFDKIDENAEQDWRTLAKFGVERNDDFDLDSEFGAVTAAEADIEGTVELTARPGTMAGGVGIHEIFLKNPYMGFADFRAAFTPDSANAFSVDPAEGSISQREDTTFSIRFRPESIGQFEGHLVIQTEDFKKVWKVIGSTA